MKRVMYVRANGIYSDSRATKEITALAKAGYDILVVGWDREGDSDEKCKAVFNKYLEHIEIIMFKYQVKDRVGFKNIGKLFNWLRFVAETLKENLKTINVIHACNLDSILFCCGTCKKYGIKIVYDIFDYYIDAHISIPAIIRPLIEMMEIRIINSADITIICTEERREQIAKAKPQKVIVIHNTPDVEMVSTKLQYDYFYCGTFGVQRLISEIFDGYDENADLKIGFAGYGIYKDRAIGLASQYENFTYLGQIKYKECLDYEATAICLSAIYEPTIRNHRLCAPNKFYESLGLGKPVIVCRGTGIDRIVEENNIGIVINYDVKEFYTAVRKLKDNPELCKEMGRRARQLYDDIYNWALMEKILLDSYKEIISTL